MAVTNIPNVQNWTVTPQNGQSGYFDLMNTWLGQSTLVIASLQSAITAQNAANAEINTLASQAESNAIIATGLANYQGDYSTLTTYSKSQSVSVAGLYYTSKVDGNSNYAVTDSNYWVANPINDKVSVIGDETIAGVKTFSSSPIVPTPTAGTQAVNKAYSDLKVALTDFTGANQSLAASGYQKLPGSLIIQWGKGSVSSTTTNQTLNIVYPISFPSVALSNVLTHSGNAIASAGNNRGYIMSCEVGNNNGFASSYSSNGVVEIHYSWFAIGY